MIPKYYRFLWRKPAISSVFLPHYNDVIMGAIASLITSLTIVYASVYSSAYQRKHQGSASLAFVRGIHRGHKWPVTAENVSIRWRHHEIPEMGKVFQCQDVIMQFVALWTLHNLCWFETLQESGFRRVSINDNTFSLFNGEVLPLATTCLRIRFVELPGSESQLGLDYVQPCGLDVVKA